MDVKIVDTSALAALLFGEPEAEAIAAQLAGARLVAPALVAFELANVCLIKSRRHPEHRSAFLTAFGMRDRFGIEDVMVNHAEVVALAV